MSLADTLARHLALCDELHQLCLEENRILKQERRAPDAPWRERKQELAARFDVSVQEMRTRQPQAGDHGGELLERARQRSLQILHLDRENEQLLLRCSLAPARPDTPPPPPSAAGALRAYGRKV
ncbi:MAG: hypothetical protein NTU80_10490 [Verrucomicrobia bacterium]|nr:hypothetical protein [Verrucomicrobiota bacterium]